MKDQIKTINPATGEEINSYSVMETEEIKRIANYGRSAFPKWKSVDLKGHYTCGNLDE
jgi:acyl-CoA reductase-like NAD-dependent aldehyde dehydrogenase